ncbi:MAG: hypothetical protein K2P78_14580 [Gemmataceae bacterium]|nr:hypothetical protein [Gemmataceae bacterium]
MSDLARRPEDTPAPADRAAVSQRRKDNPLLWLPADWRRPVGFFCQFFSDVLKGENGIVTRFRLWAQEDGLTLDEARAAMKRLMEPVVCARTQYAGQLLAELAVQVREIVKDRRAREEQERRRAEAEEAMRNSAGGAAEWRRLRDGIGTGGG